MANGGSWFLSSSVLNRRRSGTEWSSRRAEAVAAAAVSAAAPVTAATVTVNPFAVVAAAAF